MGELELRVICAWCSTPLHGRGPGTGGGTSHGICVTCAEGFIKRLPAAYLSSIADADGTVTLFSGHRFHVTDASS
jgi:hypothetical protein